MCNFTPVKRENYCIGVPKSGSYKVILNTDSEEFGGNGEGTTGSVKSKKEPMHGLENSISLDLPGLSVIYLKAPVTRKKTQKENAAKKTAKE